MRLAKVAAWSLAGLLGLLTLYLLAAWIGSSIPRNPDWHEPNDGVTIMVETNGLHTGIVMPVANEVMDWRAVFPSARNPLPSGDYPTHVAIGWGEREVFLNVPYWSDLKPGTAMRVATTGGPALLRVAHYVRPMPSEYHRPLKLRPWEYQRLARFIATSIPAKVPGEARATYQSYERNAVHHDALGRYTSITTCNTWVGNALAHAGVRIGAWTPLSGGVMKWVPEPGR